MAEIKIDTPEGIVLSFELAGPGTRTLAAAVDLAIFMFFLLLLVFFSLSLGSGLGVVVLAGAILFLVGYPLFFAALGKRATPGKHLLGLRVVDQRGFPATLTQHFLRSLFFPLELAPPFSIGLLAILFTERHQRLGDLVAGTLVLREQGERAAKEPFPGDRWSDSAQRHALTPALIERFERSDLHYLRELLGRAGMESHSRERLVLRSAALYLKRLGRDLPPHMNRNSAYAFLRELYLFLREMRGRLAS